MNLTCYLLKASVREPQNAIKADRRTELRRGPSARSLQGAVYWASTPREDPEWASWVNEFLPQPLDLLTGANHSVLFFTQVKGRWFVYTFGYGRHFLDEAAYEPDFGIKVTLNKVHPERIRVIEAQSFTDDPLHVLKKSGRRASMGVFGLNPAQDLLHAVAGEPADVRFAQTIAGREALAMRARVRPSELIRKSTEILDAYESTAYRENFSWVDSFKIVKDPGLRSRLDESLMAALNAEGAGGFQLCAPEMFDALDAARFQFELGSVTGDPRAFPDLREYLRLADDAGITIDLGDLRRHRLVARPDGSPADGPTWSIYKSLTGDIQLDNRTFVISKGEWYAVAASLAQDIHSRARNVPSNRLVLPDATNTEVEREYNERVAASEAFALLDRKLIRTNYLASSIEACDLYTPNKELIHVKSRHGSAALSHLFIQGQASCQALVSDDAFRRQMRAYLAASPVPGSSIAEPPRPADHHVVFGIITKPVTPWPVGLPFLTKFAMVEAVRNVRAFGFQASVTQIRRR